MMNGLKIPRKRPFPMLYFPMPVLMASMHGYMFGSSVIVPNRYALCVICLTGFVGRSILRPFQVTEDIKKNALGYCYLLDDKLSP